MLSAEPHWANREASGEASYGRSLYNFYRFYDPATGRYLSVDPYGVESRVGDRSYDSRLGRWTTSSDDPIRFQNESLSRYAYASNNPCNLIDRDALRPGESYPIASDAANQALDDVTEQSYDECREYGGWVYKLPNGTWTYGRAKRGSQHRIVYPRRPTSTARPYHTHGCCEPNYNNEMFSGIGSDPNDPAAVESDAALSDRLGAPSYLGTPTGSRLRYDPDPSRPRNGRVSNIR